MKTAVGEHTHINWEEHFQRNRKLYTDAVRRTNGITEPASQLPTDCLLIKADVSGIQEFIFNINRKGAARQLKARSFVVQAIMEIIWHAIAQLDVSAHLIYNGGGNFYAFCSRSKLEELEKIQKQVAIALNREEVFITLEWVAIEHGVSNFGYVISRLDAKTARRKLQRGGDLENFFDPALINDKFHDWKDLTKAIIRAEGFTLRPRTGDRLHLEVDDNTVSFLNYTLELKSDQQAATRKFRGPVYSASEKSPNAALYYLVNKLPTWEPVMRAPGFSRNSFTDAESIHNDAVISFENLSQLARLRTGTEKLAVLKYDADSLGKLFQSISDISKAESLSQAITYFFSGHLNSILQQPVTGCPLKTRLADNVYVLFAGGDDAFLLGAWDAVFHLAVLMQQELSRFCKDADYQLTISTGIVLIDPNTPVRLFADMAEEALDNAKRFAGNGELNNLGWPVKDGLRVFGITIRWRDFEKVIYYKNQLKDFITKYEQQRAILDVIKRSVEDFERLSATSEEYQFNLPKVWQLRYHFRQRIGREGRDPQTRDAVLRIMNDLISAYEKNLLEGYLNNDNRLLHILPIAARWTEFETRTKK